MTPRNYVLFYVAEPQASAHFYGRLFEREPLENSPTFALFALGDALLLGLWKRDTVRPVPAGLPGASELCLRLADDAAVDAVHARWRELGMTIAQAPTRMDFGYTCLALDPDGHRLRAFARAE